VKHWRKIVFTKSTIYLNCFLFLDLMSSLHSFLLNRNPIFSSCQSAILICIRYFIIILSFVHFSLSLSFSIYLADLQAHTHTLKDTDRKRHTPTHSKIWIDTQTHRNTGTQTHRNRGTQTHSFTAIQRHRQRERHTCTQIYGWTHIHLDTRTRTHTQIYGQTNNTHTYIN